MKTTYFLGILLSFSIWSCGTNNSSTEEQDSLDHLEVMLNGLSDEQTGRIKPNEARLFIDTVLQFVATYPDGEQSPQQLYKAAEVARSIEEYSKALAIYAQIENDFPKYEKAPKALFMQAFTYGEDLNDEAKAKELYEAFIAKYPDDDFVDDAQILIQTMGKTDEEIFESLGKE